MTRGDRHHERAAAQPDLIVQMAIYPGEVEAAIAGSNGEARSITATGTVALTAGSLEAFELQARRAGEGASGHHGAARRGGGLQVGG